MPKEKTWVYKSNGRVDFGLVIKPTTKLGMQDGFGNFSHSIVSPAVYLKFNNGVAVIDEAFAKRVGHPVEILAEWANKQPQIGGQYFLVQSPDMSLTKVEIDKIEKEIKAKKKSFTKVMQGARSTEK